MSAADSAVRARGADGQDTSWLGRIPLYPVLLAFSLMAVAYIASDIGIWAALRPMVVAVVAALLLTGLGTWAFRDLRLGGLAAGAAIVILRTADLLHAAAAVLLLGLSAVALLLFARLRRTAILPAATRLLNVLAIVLVAVIAAQAVVAGVPGHVARDIRLAGSRAALPAAAATGADPPDIYLIMLEDYPRADTLSRVFGFANESFLEGLRADGFAVATNSRSNYMYTALNLSALLQMQYVESLPGVAGWRAGNGPEPSLYGFVNDNPAFDDLRASGYTLFSGAERWEGSATRSVDEYCASGQINEFEFQRIGDSLVGSALDLVAPSWQAARDRSVISAEIACAREQVAALVNGPRFVFAHIEGPHLPVVFDENGGPAPASVYAQTAEAVEATPEEFRQSYLAELRYLNGQVLDLVAQIRARASRPPVIVVMSDEGSESHLDWKDGSRSDLQERFGILFAASTPAHPDLFGADPITVNVFATLLNAYLGTAHPVRAPQFFVSNAGTPLRTTEVADPFGS